RGFNASSGARQEGEADAAGQKLQILPPQPDPFLRYSKVPVTQGLFAFLLGVQLPGRQLTCHGLSLGGDESLGGFDTQDGAMQPAETRSFHLAQRNHSSQNVLSPDTS
ncbi:hypothetical protein, partial [Rhizobium leguminosarum]|uniref:hypothetical protein n=2 Tax=Rhizobium leguminosarum TaxID=384 RepID=UPI00197CFD50